MIPENISIWYDFVYFNSYLPGPSQVWGLGSFSPPPQFLAKQLTLFQPEGQIMHTTVIQAPPEFQTLQRPCLLPMNMKNFWDNA